MAPKKNDATSDGNASNGSGDGNGNGQHKVDDGKALHNGIPGSSWNNKKAFEEAEKATAGLADKTFTMG